MAVDRDYEDRFESQLSSKDIAGALATAQSAFRDEDVDEHTLALIAGNIYERELADGFGLIEEFVERYPSSLHTMRVFLADLHARRGDFDSATCEARTYLRQVQDTDGFRDLENTPVIRDGVARAFMLLTAAYTEVGARSYSLRALKRALSHPVTDSWQDSMLAEIDQLTRELREPAHLDLDQRWEGFFQRGEGAKELADTCREHEFNILAERVMLLEMHFLFEPGFRVNESEVLQIECRSEDDVPCLA